MKSKGKFCGLQFKLLKMILALVALPIIVISVIAYVLNAHYLTEQIHASNENAVNKTAMALEYALTSIRDDTLEVFQQDMVYSYLTADRARVEQTTQGLFSYLGNHLSYNKYISEIQLQRADGYSVRTSSVYRNLTEEQKLLADLNRGRLTFVGEAEASFSSSWEEAYVFARLLKDSNTDFRDIGYMQVIVPKAIFDDILREDEEDRMDNLLVNEGTVMISSEPEYVGKTVEKLFGKGVSLNKKSGSLVTDTESGSLNIRYSQIDQFGWYLVSCIDPVGFQASPQRNTLIVMLLLLGLVLLVVCAILARKFSSMILHPLSVVAESMKDLEQNDYNLTILEKGNDEITVLTKSFNKMSRRIHELLNDVYLFQIKEKEAQLKALQAYIDPHFLYNTLDTICWMSRMEDAPETGQLVEALSSLLRTAVKTDDGITSVEKELEYTRNYLMIQECRYADSIEFEFEIESDLEHCKTVNFALQPLIENAILHGIEPKGEPGHIRIRVCRDKEKLIYSVSDDGAAADSQELNDLIRNYEGGQRGLAIAGLNTRIRLCFGEGWGLHYEQNPNGGLIAVVTQPLLIREEKDAEINDCG